MSDPQPKTGVRGFVHRNLVLLVCVPMIIGVHWGWYKLQENENVVRTPGRSDPYEIIQKHVKQKWKELTESKKEEN